MSSAQQSYLTSVGYDMVVATTQKALNATMLLYLSEKEKIQATTAYYVWQRKENSATHRKEMTLVGISLKELQTRVPGVNPFDISADADPDSDVNLQRLRFAQFACAFSITPGLPEGIAPQKMPNIIELGTESSSVRYNMLCSDVKLCSMVYTGMDVSWQTFSQPPQEPWAFSCTVDLRMSTDNNGSAFSRLDPSIQQVIRASFQGEDAFSVQQLLFDLDNAGLETVPTMKILGGDQVLDPNVTGLINGTFLSAYFADMHARGQPLLHVAVVSPKADQSEFRATDMTMEVSRLLDSTTGKPLASPTLAQQNLSTLNYLCMSQGRTLPPLTQMKWNWMTEAESQQYDGVIAYSRNGFADMLKQQLESQVLENCFIACPIVWKDGGSIPQYAVGFKRLSGGEIINPKKRDDIEEWLARQGGAPIYNRTNAPDAKVMEWSWTQDPAGYDESRVGVVVVGSLIIKPSYSCQVEFRQRQIVITQHLVIWMKMNKEQHFEEGNIIDITLVEPIDLKVDNGILVPTPAPTTTTDQSYRPSANGFINLFSKINDEINMVADAAKLTTTKFETAPVNIVQKFQFPGGKTFAFRDFQFSNNQDLTAAITYVDPAGN